MYDKNSPFNQFCDELKIENVPLWNEEENLSSSCLIGIQGTPLAYCCSMSRLPGRGIRCSHVTVYVTNNLGITGNKIFIPLLAINSSFPNNGIPVFNWKFLIRWQLLSSYGGRHSLTTLTRLWPFLTIYIPRVDICKGIPLLL